MCRLTLAWVTSENSTKQLECRHLLTQSSSLDPILSPTVSGVDRICPWFHANSSADSPLCCPVANCSRPGPVVNCLSASFSNQLSFRVPLPLPDTARFQVQKSFVWFRAKTDKGIVCSGHPYSATYIYIYIYIYIYVEFWLMNAGSSNKKTNNKIRGKKSYIYRNKYL